jgi:predicted DNA-binding protein (MmcQ/YjbR family)
VVASGAVKAQSLDPKVLRRLRAICLALPEVSETSSWGHPNWRTGKRTFAVLEVYRGRPSICLKPSSDGYRELAGDPRWYVTPYVGHRGWLSRIVDDTLDWSEIERLVRESFREHATARALAALDGAARSKPAARPRAKRATVSPRPARGSAGTGARCRAAPGRPRGGTAR